MTLWVILGAISAFLAVALGAMGAHAFKLSDDALRTFQTANQYHMWHALGLLLIAALAGKLPAWGMTIGEVSPVWRASSRFCCVLCPS